MYQAGLVRQRVASDLKKGMQLRGRYRTSSLILPREHVKTSQGIRSRSLETHVESAVCTAWVTSLLHGSTTMTSRCDALAVVPCEQQQQRLSKVVNVVSKSKFKEMKRKIEKAIRMFLRFIKVALTLAPVAVLYPIQLLSTSRSISTQGKKSKDQQDAHEVALQWDVAPADGPLGWYLRVCLQCVERSGAAVIKLMQWAGSRPDMFGHEFCSVFSQLQDHTTPHPLSHTESVLAEAFGDDWSDRIRIQELIGSGCIGQVYKGSVLDMHTGKWKEVAIKVMHPNVRDDIDTDLDLIRLVGRLSPYFAPKGIRWLNVDGAIDEFAKMLKLQLDLRTEAYNLSRFLKNFKSDPEITFPELIDGYEAAQDVLIEGFCKGIPITKYARENPDDKEHLSKLCLTGIKAVCRMIFEHNWLHGDLHPGNVLVDPDTKKLVLLDVGIVTSYSPRDHQVIVDVLTSFIHKDGRRAGRLLIEDSNHRLANEDAAVDEELYIDKIEALTIKASGKDYLMEHLGTYISYICEAAATHHVMMNQSFVSAALAIKVQEGIALALDPSVEIWRVANPIILKSEARRRMKAVGRRVEETVLGKDSALSRSLGLHDFLHEE